MSPSQNNNNNRKYVILVVVLVFGAIHYILNSSPTSSVSHDSAATAIIVGVAPQQVAKLVVDETHQPLKFKDSLNSVENSTSNNFHQKYFGARNWKQLSISNPADRFSNERLQQKHVQRFETFEDYFEQERDLFRPHLLSSSSSSPICFIPYEMKGAGKSILTKPGSSAKYNMKAELCWAPMKQLLSKEMKKSSSPRRRNGCLGLVKISTKDVSKPNYCEATKNIFKTPISGDPRWSEILRSVVGPLHLRLLLEGPEVVSATVFFDEQNCEYWLHFFVASPGFYGINFKFVHDDYWGVNEVSHNTKHNLNGYCFPRNMPLLKCDCLHSDEDAVNDALDLAVSFPHQKQNNKEQDDDKNATTFLNSRWVQRPTGVGKWAGKFLLANTLQLVPYYYFQNSLRSATQVIGVDPRAVPPFGVAKLATKENAKYSLQFPTILSDKRLNPKLIHDFPLEKWMAAEELTQKEKCKVLNIKNSREQEKKDASPLWIFVMGDSQSRSITWSLKNYLQTAEMNNQGNTSSETEKESYDLRDKDGRKLTRSSDVFLNDKWRVSYIWDSYLDLLVDDEDENKKSIKSVSLNATEQEREKLKKASLERAQVFVAGLGHHPASWGQWTFAEYYEKSRKIAARLCFYVQEKNKKVFWYGAPSWPKAKLVNNFRGTNQRIALFNGLMLRHFEEECERKRSVNVVMAAGSSDQYDQEKVLYLVDFFGITSPVMKYSKDGSHYDGSVVVSTCAHQVFSSLCL